MELIVVVLVVAAVFVVPGAALGADSRAWPVRRNDFIPRPV